MRASDFLRELVVNDNANYDAWATIANRLGAELVESVAEDSLSEFAPGDGYSGNGGDNPVSWETAKMMFNQFAEDSNALDFQERDGGSTIATIWGPEFGHPYDYFGLYVSPYGEHAMTGMLLGIGSDNKITEIKKFALPLSTNGVDTAVRYYMAMRS